ncbi:expansin family protein [Thelephora ganbajun]|uniref:Expansin family protein n=1 Tax=Thelephora ganbajun TaxID=370292 RepID=A0ACB6ZM69_THEGA|nr:expansin family protein [Thelephora ganbajun]
MFTLAKLVVLLTAALLVAAMPSHLARNTYNHREIAARVAQPEVVPAPEIVARDISDPAKRLIRKKRARNGRCKPKSSSVVVLGTFYATGLGACGITNNDGQDIAAVSHSFFDSFPGYDGVNPNNNPMCSKTAEVTYNGITIHVKLTDRCEGCAYGDLDFSPNAFKQLADFAAGRISGISWRIID